MTTRAANSHVLCHDTHEKTAKGTNPLFALLLLLGTRTLDLGRSSELLGAVLALLACWEMRCQHIVFEEMDKCHCVVRILFSLEPIRHGRPIQLPPPTPVESKENCVHSRCCLLAFSIFFAMPTRTSL